jgi:K+-sensing histidine kinase KdpD
MPPRLGNLRFLLKHLFGIALSAGLAALLCFLVGDIRSRWAVPVLFLLALIPIAELLGKTAGIFGSAAASFVFAVLLFPPLGSPAVQDVTDRVALISFQVIAIGVALLCQASAQA